MLHNIKNKIKSNKYLRVIYDKLQCMVVVTQYNFIKRYYSLKKEKSNKSVSYNTLNNTKPSVFYFGGDELQDKSGFLQALDKYTHLTYFTKEDGSYGSYNFGVNNRDKNIEKNSNRLIELLNNMKQAPDVLLMQTWEWRIGLETLKKIRKLYPNIIIANIAMDDRHSFWLYGSKRHGSAGLIEELDFAFTTSSEAVEWYKKEGCNAYFYPLASDPNVFFPIDIEKIYDVGFVGAKYGIREQIVNQLELHGVKVKAYGNGWENGRLPIEDTNKFYNQCKIVLGVSTILGCNNFVSMKLRDFDVPMSGSVYITNYNKDTADIFMPDREVIYYKNIDECIDKIKKYLHDLDNLKTTRGNAYKKAITNSYEIRIKNLLKHMGYQV